MRVRTADHISRDVRRLNGCHPELVDAVLDILDALATLGFPMFVTSGVRTEAEQLKLYAQGRTTPGVIVTHLDGLVKRSNHQTKADGYGWACDVAFIDDPDTPKTEIYDPAQPWQLLGAMVEAKGLRWGGRFKSLVDLPHIERI